MVRTKHWGGGGGGAYDACKVHYVYRAGDDYIVNDRAAGYMDATKDRLYAEGPDSPRRRAVQTVLMNILEVLVRVLAPVLSFTPDEVSEHHPEAIRPREGRPGNVPLAGCPDKSAPAPPQPRAADAEPTAQALALLPRVRPHLTTEL